MPTASTATARFVALVQKLQRRRPNWAVYERRRRAPSSGVIYKIDRNKQDVLSDYVSSDYDSSDDDRRPNPERGASTANTF